MTIKKLSKVLILLVFLAITFYGLGRLYYYVTGGFTIGNITHDVIYNANWDIPPLTASAEKQLNNIFEQPFYYLGKGCQSYVFESEDRQYVIKFMKYQRFRPRPWLEYLTFIPGMKLHYQNKVEQKKAKLDSVFTSWKIAYLHLKKESGVVYVHLNKSKNLHKKLIIYDKLRMPHAVEIDNYQFLIQRKAEMLCPTIDAWMAKGDIDSCKVLLTQLLDKIAEEYKQGYADNDHALMQNTGVLDREPVHIDVGQFVKNKSVQKAEVAHQEMFNKTWKFRKWLEKHHPVLSAHLVLYLKNYMGEEKFLHLLPRLNKAEMGILFHQSE